MPEDAGEMNPEIKKTDLTPSELKAIEDRKYFMSIEQGREISIEEAIGNFIAGYQKEWVKEKQRRDNLAQREEIEKHKWLRSKEAGRDIGEHAAAEEWRETYAHIWREERESLEKNGFKAIQVTVKNKKGFHMRPSSTLVNLVKNYDCDVYVHKNGMDHFNFIMNKKPYLNIKSVLNILTLAVVQGDELEFIATGQQATEALSAIADLVNKSLLG